MLMPMRMYLLFINPSTFQLKSTGLIPRWRGNRPLIDGSKPATTSRRPRPEFYFVPFSVRKSICSLVRQLRGPHLSA
jgi:hypothetical protein